MSVRYLTQSAENPAALGFSNRTVIEEMILSSIDRQPPSIVFPGKHGNPGLNRLSRENGNREAFSGALNMTEIAQFAGLRKYTALSAVCFKNNANRRHQKPLKRSYSSSSSISLPSSSTSISVFLPLGPGFLTLVS